MFDISIDPVIRNLESRPWIQGWIEMEGGAVCAHGAVMTCKKLKPGDKYIIRAVMRNQGLDEEWNDEAGRTKVEVLKRLRGIEVTDASLVSTFGPQWEPIIALVRHVSAALTDSQAALLSDAWVARGAGRKDARRAAYRSARHGERVDTRRASVNAARLAVAGRGTYISLAVEDAAVALAVRDLIRTRGFTQEHYDILTAPWAGAIGKVHPDD